MAKLVRGRWDADLKAIRTVLESYEADHPGARAELYRRGNTLIRIRIVSPHFRGMSLTARDNELWTYLERLDEEVLQQVTILLLLTPQEQAASLMNLEFDAPVRSIA
ncbi:MAG TPA: hypothetical protein VH253_09590 [Phycisphaerae bacterium]|nr:hypothetical protein [Phycisphaerae bacterium]